MILLDTNLLSRMTSRRDPQCAAARRSLHLLSEQAEQLAIVPQNLYEFWSVATRALQVNGLGLTIEQASQWLGYFRRRFT